MEYLDYEDDFGSWDFRDECGVEYITGGNDPYSTSCDLTPGHAQNGSKHEGPDPFGGNGRIRWNGGGVCAGDRIPASGIETLI